MRNVLREGVAVKCGVIEQMRPRYPVPPMCRFLGVSISGYYAWRDPRAVVARSARAAARKRKCVPLTSALGKPLAQNGYRRTWRITASRSAFPHQALCTKLGLRCKQKRKFKATTNSVRNLPVAPNILDQDFSESAPNQAWCGDITYIATDEGRLYLAGLKDLFSGELVGYAMSERLTKHLVMQALFRAVALHRMPAGLITTTIG